MHGLFSSTPSYGYVARQTGSYRKTEFKSNWRGPGYVAKKITTALTTLMSYGTSDLALLSEELAADVCNYFQIKFYLNCNKFHLIILSFQTLKSNCLYCLGSIGFVSIVIYIVVSRSNDNLTK